MIDEDLPTTSWSGDPERVDPDDYAPSAPYVKQMTWAECPDCDVQVHAPVTQFVYRGLTCPRCGNTVLSPPADSEEWTQRVLREEDELAEQLS